MYKFVKILLILFIIIGVFGLSFGISLAGDKININTASVDELDSLPGIGEIKAQAIVDYRGVNGPFEATEEIMEVNGIGVGTYENIKDLISIGDENNSNNEGINNIVINELFPNPAGKDDQEWIELKNLGSTNVNLAGFKISDLSKTYTISLEDFNSTIINAGEFFIIPKSISGITLNNSNGETIKLFNSGGQLIGETSYTGSVKDDIAWARDADGSYAFTVVNSPGAENILVEEQIENKEESSEVDGGVEQGSSEDKKNEGAKEKQEKKIFINEYLPNPWGIDDGEWIELYNTSTQAINLDGWILEDNVNMFKLDGLRIEANSYLVIDRAISGLILNNIYGDNISLIDNTGYLVDTSSYKKKPVSGESYNWCGNLEKWIWLDSVSEGGRNSCPLKNDKPVAYFELGRENIQLGDYIKLDARESFDYDGEIKEYIWEFAKPVQVFGQASLMWQFREPQVEVKFILAGKNTINLKVIDNLGGEDIYSQKIEVIGGDEDKVVIDDKVKSNKIAKAKSVKFFNKLGLSEVKKLKEGSFVAVEGQVVAEPGLLGKTIFYIVDKNSGIQVYSYKKDFPDLAMGDKVLVKGILDDYQSEMRIKIKNKKDIVKLAEGGLNEPAMVQIEDINEDREGSLVKISGELVEIKGSAWWVDDGTEEVKVYIKQNTQIKKNDLKVGDEVSVVGIVSEWKGEYRILPRFPDDIISLGVVLGEASQIVHYDDSGDNEFFKYLFVIMVGVVIVLVSIIIRLNERKKKRYI